MKKICREHVQQQLCLLYTKSFDHADCHGEQQTMVTMSMEKMPACLHASRILIQFKQAQARILQPHSKNASGLALREVDQSNLDAFSESRCTIHA